MSVVWEINRLRRSLMLTVLAWASSLHDPATYARLYPAANPGPSSEEISAGPQEGTSIDSKPAAAGGPQLGASDAPEGALQLPAGASVSVAAPAEELPSSAAAKPSAPAADTGALAEDALPPSEGASDATQYAATALAPQPSMLPSPTSFSALPTPFDQPVEGDVVQQFFGPALKGTVSRLKALFEKSHAEECDTASCAPALNS